MVTGDPGASGMFTRCTSAPLIQTTKPSSTFAPSRSEAICARFVTVNERRRKKQV